MLSKKFNNVDVLIKENDLIKTNVIYRLIFPNNKSYIGKTTQQLRRRLYIHCNRAYSSTNKSNNLNRALAVSIRYYQSFQVEVLYQGDDLYNKECEYIQLYNSFVDGYNSSIGGNGSLGFTLLEESRQKISKAKLNKPKSREICQYSSDGVFIKQWPTIVSAARELSLDSSTLGKCCREIRNTCGGFI